MNNETPFHIFIRLIESDQKINQFNKKKEAINEKKLALANQHNTLVKNAQDAQNRWINMRKAVDVQELEMKMLDAQEQQLKHRLDNATDYKMYQAIKSEVAQIKQKQHDLEDGIIAAWADLENAKKEYNAQTLLVTQSEENIEKETDTLNAELAQIDQEIAPLMQDRTMIEEKIPEEWRDKYILMRARVPNPVVPVVNGICSACFYQVHGPDMMALEHRKLLQCKDCFRLLYLPSAMGQ